MTDPSFLNDQGRPAVRLERRYPHPVERVWRAVTESASLTHWFPSEVEFDLAAGKVVFDPNGPDPMTGLVLESDPPRRLIFTWDSDQLEFTLAPDGDGTLFTLTHRFDDRPGAASFATGWEQCLNALLNEAAPAPQGRKATARHEELVLRFGLDQPEITWAGQEWTIRYERQLSCDADTAWNLLFGDEVPIAGHTFPPRVSSFPAASNASQAVSSTFPPGDIEFRTKQPDQTTLGRLTTVDAPRAFTFEVPDGVPGRAGSGRLGAGTGQGARLFLEVTGSGKDELQTALVVWGTEAVAGLARAAAALG
ncbi:hypothetical protein Kisp01_01490 [Kineosporia sp. NBRC 101677]|uniref:SRPBCC family protein n=1 Tax=Kineosporia sp. NBRC 101677 TaxID=3032197 RepID=UPI0024A53167|nr:SRPBCC family protein [Kineosporia sp. NBRC 101677]GLY13133.1 hypothetical protein Kisp01_01490 [Kineosporia sp. NBRC 101677]